MRDSIPRPVAYAIRQHVPPTKAFRLYARISVEQLSAETGITIARIVMIEKGRALSFDEAVRLSEALDVPVVLLSVTAGDLVR